MPELITETQHGFDWGAAKVERCISHKGYVVVCVRNEARTSGVHVQVSPAGRVVSVRPWGKARVVGWSKKERETFE